MAYTDYTFYTGTYKGNAIPETSFERLSEKASTYIDTYTFGRAESYEDTENKLQMACCALADVYYQYENGGSKASEKVGDYSVTYTLGISNTPSQKEALKDTIKLYLGSTGLLYGGV